MCFSDLMFAYVSWLSEELLFEFVLFVFFIELSGVCGIGVDSVVLFSVELCWLVQFRKIPVLYFLQFGGVDSDLFLNFLVRSYSVCDSTYGWMIIIWSGHISCWVMLKIDRFLFFSTYYMLMCGYLFVAFWCHRHCWRVFDMLLLHCSFVDKV
jgi:hypothetical protein